MNKKRLSVVMAGAMLATSVAPVLAAETTATEYGISKKALLKKNIVDKANSKLITTQTSLFTAANGFVSSDVETEIGKGGSAYGIKVLDKDGKEKQALTYKVSEIETALDNVVATDTVKVYERETSTFLGQVIPGTEIKSTGVAAKDKFDSKAFTSLAELETAMKGKTGLTFTSKAADDTTTKVTGNDYIESVTLNDTKTGATIKLKALKNLADEKEGNVTIDVKVGDDKLNLLLPVDSKDNLLTNSAKDVMNCVGFAKLETYQPSAAIVSAAKEIESYKLVDDSTKYEEVTYLASDLYDGLALTAKGTEIQLDLENAKKENERTGNALTVELSSSVPTLSNGVASFTVTYFASHKDNVASSSDDKPSKVVTVKSTNLEEVKSLYNMLKDGSYEVGIVAGDNRYETAVNVAKAQKLAKLSTSTAAVKKENNIVLVNGNSLVDGLAAAPLAASLKWNDSTVGTAVLLSKADSLPTATKEYLEELTSEIPVSRRQYVTINLVGGETVLSKSLVEELEEMGFSVERYGGDNREETSLEVATAVKPNDTNGVFVVGANGEADAMSIATIAAKRKAPIIVAKAGGLSNDAVKFIKNNYAKADNDKVAIIGGESTVSKAEYDRIDAVVTNKVARVSGDNRFETNAAIINKYSGNFGEVILVKDGQANKDELIDALSAANYAAKSSPSSPIVLATDKITDTQKTAILNQKGTVTKLTQVGQGVARTTLESVAEFLGLSNVK